MVFFKKLLNLPLEALFWIAALAILAFNYPNHDSAHFTICPLALSGWDWCPGCGLGTSISFFFRGEFSRSFQAHPFGIFAIIVLTCRIVQLTKHYLKYGPRN